MSRVEMDTRMDSRDDSKMASPSWVYHDDEVGMDSVDT